MPFFQLRPETVLQSSDTFYPPGLNHFVTFNTSVVFSPRTIPSTIDFNCNFRSGSSNLALRTSLRLQQGEIFIFKRLPTC